MDRIQGTQVTELVTGSLTASFVIPAGYPNITVCVGAVSASTSIVFKAHTGVTAYNIPEDVYGTTYPRADFTGNEVVTLIGVPPCHLVASVDSGVTGTIEVCAWD